MSINLNKSDKETGFYEAFSDVIFATMAIFVLLMIIFLLLAHESSPIAKLKKRIEAVEQQTQTVTAATDRLAEDSAVAEEEVAKMAERNVEIAIAVDKSGGMEQELNNLKRAISRLGEILPGVAKEVKIGVVAYRINENYHNATDVFPLTRIVKTSADQGRSVGALKQYLRRQNHASGLAPILEATQQAISMFNPAASFNGHQVLMILGDVGPYEESIQGADEITAQGERKAGQLVNLVGQWVKSKKNRNIILLFSGRDEIYRPLGGQDRRHKHSVSMELFKQIAAAAGQPKAYTENQSSMLADFLVAALKRK